MSSEIKIKALIGTFTGVVAYLLDSFTSLLVILVFCMVIDYVTGLIAAYFKKNIQSSIGLKGILKKIGYMLLVTLAFFLDYLVVYHATQLNIELPFNGTFGFATTIWLIGNEGVSIIENLGVIGVPIPSFLKCAFEKLKDKTCSRKDGEQV
jgi:toxin secretion/phage lysis holin